MHVMINDGGVLQPNQDQLAVKRISNQRGFLLEIVSSAIAVTLLKGAEFRDSKVNR